MLNLVVLTNFWKKEPKMPILCHLDHVLEHFGQVKHDFKPFFLHEKGDVHPSCMLYTFKPLLMSGAMMSY